MKKYSKFQSVGLMLAVLGLFAMSGLVYAQTATPTPTATPTRSPKPIDHGRWPTLSPSRTPKVQELKEKIQEKREEVKEKIQEKRQEIKQKLEDKRKKSVEEYWRKIAKRFQAAIEREGKLIERIQSHIDKRKADGKDTSAAQAQLDIAKQKLTEAKATFEELKTAAKAAIDSETPKEAFAKVKEIMHKLERILKDLHQAIVKTLRILKGASITKSPSPTPSASATPALTATPTSTSTPSPTPTP